MKAPLLIFASLLAALTLFSYGATPAKDGSILINIFRNQVDRRLYVPRHDQIRYAQFLEDALSDAALQFQPSQYVLMVDRNPKVQAIFIFWLDARAPIKNRMHFIGASPVSTGKPGQFDHFITPLGIFSHTPINMDYRAEGTPNGLGRIALGRKGSRVFDFGWTEGERGWGRGGKGQMRLLMHATDPDHLEPYLGTPMSKGCIRIPTTLNAFIDRHGLLDADYEQGLLGGKQYWALHPARTPTPWPGRYLVIVDSESLIRPDWSPDPLNLSSSGKPPIAEHLIRMAVEPCASP